MGLAISAILNSTNYSNRSIVNMSKIEIRSALESWMTSLDARPKHILLLPPDFTRSNSQAGLIVQEVYEMLGS